MRSVGSHRFESLRKGAAHFNSLGDTVEGDMEAPLGVPVNFRDGSQIDDAGAVDLPEQIGVEFLEQFPDGFAQKRLGAGGAQARVFFVCREEENILDRDELNGRSD